MKSIHTKVLPPDDVSSLLSDELRKELASALTATAHGLARAAMIWSELQRRGEDTPELRSGLATWLPRIARAELAAEAVIAFAGQRMLLQRMIGMPLDQQRLLAGGADITVAIINERGEIVGTDKPLTQLSSRDVLLAIDGGQVRPLSAQIRTLSHSITKTKSPRRGGGSVASIRADRHTGMLAIGRSRIAPSDLADALHILGFNLVRIIEAK